MGVNGMLNFCIFVFIAFAAGRIIAMMRRPAEFFTVFIKKR